MYFDGIAGPHGRPNCTTTLKVAEAPAPVEHRFNRCGYRSEADCGPKPAGTIRLVVLGSSIAEGYMIPYSDMFASQMTDELAHSCARPVEFQDLAAEACPPIYAYRHLPEALRLQPDAVVLVVNPWDVEQDVDGRLLALRDSPEPISRSLTPVVHLSPVQKLQAWSHESRALAMAQHFMLQNPETFLRLYLGAGGDHTAFVRVPFSPAWERRFLVLDVILSEMSQRLRAAGVAFLVVGVPERAQTVMLSAPGLPPGVDPFAFTRRVGEIARSHQILYLDGLKVLAHTLRPASAHSTDLFYIIDGHPTGAAHRILGRTAGGELLKSGLLPCRPPAKK